jgi:hypothetical protein
MQRILSLPNLIYCSARVYSATLSAILLKAPSVFFIFLQEVSFFVLLMSHLVLWTHSIKVCPYIFSFSLGISTIQCPSIVHKRITSQSESLIRHASSIHNIPAAVGTLPRCFDFESVSDHHLYIDSIYHNSATCQCCACSLCMAAQRRADRLCYPYFAA